MKFYDKDKNWRRSVTVLIVIRHNNDNIIIGFNLRRYYFHKRVRGQLLHSDVFSIVSLCLECDCVEHNIVMVASVFMRMGTISVVLCGIFVSRIFICASQI